MSRRQAIALTLITLLAAWLRAWLDGSIVPGRTFARHDEGHYVDLARQFLNGHWSVHYFINPSLFGYLLAGVTALVGAVRSMLGFDESFALFVTRETLAPYAIVLVGRLLSITASTLSVLVVARIGRRLFSPTVGLLAALALAVDGIAMSRAVLCGNESLTVLLGLLAFERLLASMERDAPMRTRLVAGLLLGLATATKYSAGILVVPFLLVPRRDAVAAFRSGRWLALLRDVLPALLAAGLGFFAGAPMVAIHFSDFAHDFLAQAGFLHGGYRREDREAGELGYLFYARTFAASHQGWFFAIACGLGVLASIGRAIRTRERSLLLLIAASLPLYLFLGSGVFHRDRFLLPAVPFLLLHGAWIVERATHFVTSRLVASRWLAPVLAFTVVAATAAPSAIASHQLLARQNGFPDPMSQLLVDLRSSLQPGDRVIEFPVPLANRLLLEQDPWRPLGIAAPRPDLVEVARRMVHDGIALDPPSMLLQPLLARAESLAALQQALRNEGANLLLVVAATSQIERPEKLVRGDRDVGSDTAPPTWWNEFFEWLKTLPRRTVAFTSDGTITAALIELPHK